MKSLSRMQRVLVIGTFVSIALGVLGGLISEYLGAPFYFGSFFGFTLSGLTTLFWMAAVASNPPR